MVTISLINFEIASLIIVFVISLFYILRNRKNVEFKYGIVFLRWKKFSKSLEEKILKHRKILEILGYISIFSGFSMLFFGTYYLMECAIYSRACFGIVLPTVGGYEIPGPVISVSFLIWILALPLLIIPHELSHAIFSIYSKVKVKSYGLIFATLFPIGAFVDPQKKVFEKLNLKNKLFILTAGSFANFLIFLIAFLIAFLINRIVVSDGINFEVINGTPAYYANLSGTIKEINGEKIRNLVDLIIVLNKTYPNQKIKIKTNVGEYDITLTSHPNYTDKGFLGITNVSEELKYKIFGFEKKVGLEYFFINKYLFIVILLSLGIAIANMLPLKPLDGGLVIESIYSKLFERKKAEKLANIVSIFILLLLLYNLFLTSKFGFPFKLT